MKEAYDLALQRSKNRKMKDKGQRDRGACLGPLYPGDSILIQNLSEREGTTKLVSYWEHEVGVIVESKGKENLVYAVRPETSINGKIRILHQNLLLTCESIQVQRNSCDSEYSENDKEEEYTRQLEAMEQTVLI